MTFKIEISQFFDCSESKQWKQNKIRHFSMNMLKYDTIFNWSQKLKYFNCKSEHKKVNCNKIKQDICKSISFFSYIFPFLLFYLYLKFIS